MILTTRTTARRSGFTILEVLLASAIGVFLLAALYFAFDLCLRQTDSARGIAEKSDLARAITNRMTADLGASLGPLQPKSGGGVTQDSTINSGTSTSSTTTTPTTTATTTTTPTTTDSSTDTSTDTTATTTDQSLSADVPFQGGVFGTDKQLTIYASRVPTDLLNPLSAEQTMLGADPKPDLRRITYYLSATGGLCRQEQFLVTADGIRNSTDPDHSRESLDLIAEEVTDVTFEYFDGTTWTNTWAGDDDGGDGKTVKGPPRAIRMSMTMQDTDGVTKSIEHVFALRAAVGTYQAPVAADTTTTDTTTTGGSE
ncbi:prepilin-type N-terminal cleavage/methylation domain-containing protein [Limnoglobus roseus]|uniref:Type II secretion system protein J n=1 Tax=Limnoglobus roseus TaxID=2598579 RepID=A0A5C1AIW0_9BACT|nr:prepilin-type N-terminal cleavage/methylation domain-containing protein [Limnoglobus roseus]QEL18800.1 hypothetical protein PX52LOC_05840 [Limnoglobus roseus]